MRETTAALTTEDYSFYSELYIYKTTTWSEWVAENPTIERYNEETGQLIFYNITTTSSMIIFTNSEDPNDKYILSGILPDDIIVGQEYFLTPAQ